MLEIICLLPKLSSRNAVEFYQDLQRKRKEV